MSEKGGPKTGVLLLNLGTPDSTSVSDVRRYLAEFLNDPRVIDISTLGRWLLLHGIILRTRPAKSAAAYREIFGERGSPLLFHTMDLRDRVAQKLGADFVVEVVMRYGNPSIEKGVDALLAAGVEKIMVLPLFPQFAVASTGSAVERVSSVLHQKWLTPPLQVLPDFFDDQGYIEACAENAGVAQAEFKPDFVLFSYHGIPERHLTKLERPSTQCLKDPHCCATMREDNRFCYRAQCFATTRALVEELGLEDGQYQTSFQSRLGRTPWIKPYTDLILADIHASGARRILVISPSFVADCLETIEEIGIRARADWRALGGEDLRLCPSLNSGERWRDAVVSMITSAA